VLIWGKPDPNKCELVIEDNQGREWQYTGPLKKFRAETTGNYCNGKELPADSPDDRAFAISNGDRYTGHFENGKFHGRAALDFSNGDKFEYA